MDEVLVASEYANHLSDADLRLLAMAAGGPPGAAADPDRLRRDPPALLAVLADDRVFQAVLDATGPAAEAAAAVSPFLLFAVAVHRSAAELASLDYVPERGGWGRPVPLFDAPALRDFLRDPARRLFLAELLGSFTKVASGRYRVRHAGRVVTRRFSELDPVRLAGLLDAVPSAERPGVYRRLGDVALFLTGVFPDYSQHAFGPVSAARLLRFTHVPAAEAGSIADAPAIELLELLGSRWYRAALATAPVRTARLTLVEEVADRFRQARRVLNHMADRYLFPRAFPWLPRPGG
ncbi:MAG TPA: hypothetical protein VKV35_00030 [Streptosporangiaceae bacterium]|nr:hypothetical protein [Streptosporangiaceae bacterium]